MSACQSCTRNDLLFRPQRNLPLLPATRPLEFIATVISGILPKTAKENRYVVITSNRLFKLKQTIRNSTRHSHKRDKHFPPWMDHGVRYTIVHSHRQWLAFCRLVFLPLDLLTLTQSVWPQMRIFRNPTDK